VWYIESGEENWRKQIMKKFLGVPETAEMLNTTQRAIWQRIYRHQIPFRRWGKRVLIPVDELEEFLKALPGTTAKEAVTSVQSEGR
jgi:excisionase family DNA binding protein